jgi:hypothetical protein
MIGELRLHVTRFLCAAAISWIAVGVAGCGPGNGNDEFTFALATSGVACQGVHVDLNVSALDSTDAVSCTAASAVLDAGCSVSASVSGDSLALDLRGCSVPDATTLFTCAVPGANAAGLETDAVVACGCGCQDQCADSPAVCVTAGTTSDCGGSSSMAAAPSRNAASSLTVTIARGIVTTTSTSSTTCGTCCDAGIGVDAQLDDAVTLTELAFSIDISDSQAGCPMFGDCSIAIATAGNGYARYNSTNETIEVCVSDPGGFSGPAVLAQCSYFSGGPGDPYAVDVTRALDMSFQPVDPAPSVTAASNF